MTHHEITDTATVKIAAMSESTSSFPPPPPMPTPSGNILGRGIPGIQQSLFVTMVISLVGAALYLLGAINQYMVLSDLKNLNFSSETEMANRIVQADDYISNAMAIYGISAIVFLVIFIVWCNKTTKNLTESGYRPEKSSGWAVGSFFIPLGNVFFIFGTFKDLLTGLGKFFPVINSERQKSMKIWWIVSVVGGIFFNISDVTITEDSTIDEIMGAAGLEIAAALIIVVGLVFGVKAFKQLRDDTKTI
jgi:hypothetical protein